MFDRDYQMKVLEDYVDENYYYMNFPNMFRYKKNHEADRFYQMSYQQWAAYEILDSLKQEDEDHLIENDLEDLRKMFCDFSCRATNIDAKFMFSVAEEMATIMLDLILCMYH